MVGPAKFMKLRNKIASMVGNVTCVMQEMNMLTEDNEVDFDAIKARLSAMTLPNELVADLEQSVDECRQFSSCLPESTFDKSPIAAGFGRQIAFFKCMKVSALLQLGCQQEMVAVGLFHYSEQCDMGRFTVT